MVEGTLARVLRRYLNMRSKEFLKKVKRDLKFSKNEALRKALQTRKTKGRESESLKKMIDDLLEDKSPCKLASHLKIKARALTGKDAFTGFSKAHLNFLFLSYGISFKKSKKKKALSELLQMKVAGCEALPCSHTATRAIFNKALQLYNEGKKVNYVSLGISAPGPQAVSESTERRENEAGEQNFEAITNVVTPLAQQSVSESTEQSDIEVGEQNFDMVTSAPNNIREDDIEDGAQRRVRLRAFKPSKEQELLLRSDNKTNSGKVPKILRAERAREFGVKESQIQRWHVAWNKKKKSNSE